MPAIPEGTITFLFTDIEGSTRLWEERPADMKAAVERHDAISRAAIEGHGGYVFKTVGDAFCAAFGRAGDALAAASAIRGALAAEEWGPTPIRVRMGIHAGTADLRDGDYFGQTVNRVARISSAGSGGQVLVSLAARELARDALPPGATLRDLGSRRLKDISAPERLFQLDEEGLPTEFPPLKTVDSRPNNLPESPTSFIGREDEQATVIGLLDTTRLLTIAGPGGTGKTRLALECAGALLGRWRDGAWFADLSRLPDADRLESEIARALGMAEDPSTPIAESLRLRLRESELLLVLDNCEHLVDACARWAAESIAACPGLRILATSREALMVNGETTFQLLPLPVPSALNVDPASLDQYEAVRLFIDRARGAGRSFPLDAETAPLVAGICERLEGIPLAIELAAAQLRFLPLKELHGRLRDVFAALRSQARGVSGRQATLRGLVDWSWNLLDADERRAWMRLSLFRGGFGAGAAEAMLCDSSWELVERLVSKSILMLDAGESADARFRMLETLREYGSMRLDESGARAEATSAFVDWLVAFAKSAEAGLYILRDVSLYRKLDVELPNILAGLDAALATGRRDEAIAAFYGIRNYLFCGMSPFGTVSAMLDRLCEGDEPSDTATATKLLLSRIASPLVSITVDKGTLDLGEAASAAAERSGDRDLFAAAELVRAELLRILERPADAVRLALDLAADPPGTNPKAVEADATALAGACLGDAYSQYERPDPGDILGPGETLPYGLPADTGRIELSRALRMRSLELAREMGDLFRQDLASLADIMAIAGDYAGARKATEESLAFRTSAGLLAETWYQLEFLVTLACMEGDREIALARSSEFIGLAERLGVSLPIFLSHDSALNVRRRFREWEEAERLARTSYEKNRDSAFANRASRELGQVLIERGRPDEAESLLAGVVERNAGRIAIDPRVVAAAVGLRRIELERGGDPRAAARAAGAALGLLDSIPKLDGPLRPNVPASWALPSGLGYEDLARLNWMDVYPEAAVFEGFMREAEAAAGPDFGHLVREGWEAGSEALVPRR